MAPWISSTPYKKPAQSGRNHKRPKSPVPPAFEPLSPTQAEDTPFTRYIQSVQKQFRRHTASEAPHHAAARERYAQGASAHASDFARRRRSSNTINELADVALANAAFAAPAPYATHAGSSAYPYSSGGYSSRPSSSQYQWSTPQYTSTAAEFSDNNLEAAELLLNFAGQSPLISTRQPVGYSNGGEWQGSVQSVDNAAEPPNYHVNGPATYLPSPRPTSEDDRFKMALASSDMTSAIEDEQLDDISKGSHINIRTPPDEDAQSTPARDDDDEAADERPRARRGWPKGKPRGPRKSINGVGAAKTKTGSGKRSRKSTAVPSVEAETPPPRRSSHSDVTPALEIPILTRSNSVPPNCRFIPDKVKSNVGRKAMPRFTKETVCEHCNIARESLTGEMDNWISCNGCKKWFHSDCAGFESERELRDVDKFFCKPCEPDHGATTFVRKSNRAHTAVDYAGLNQGVLKTSDDCHEHHYIQPIKDGTLFNFDPETFPRMPPELVTAEYFERSACFNQPILIPAALNPKPAKRQQRRRQVQGTVSEGDVSVEINDDEMLDEFEYDTVYDDGQDRLDMVIPQNLTIRDVCNLVGPDYPLDVIDVKVQGTESTRWNLGKWADYYEMEGEKAIRNVISLEVSDTKLGRLLRRPKIVRQIDLQDNVWPAEEPFKSVAFYCLMSVEDSYTDFHVDFGGSSVYYHILRGSKTFFFIPPKPKHLKAYEDWNDSHEQNYTFLPNTTKECYRVDLFEGDTMLIPSGWIHAVWTPSNSLVIGGNFLTNMHYGMQFRIVDVEKANKTPAKFRYPKFQKVMWYAVIKYLKNDPLPDAVRQTFYTGHKFEREIPAWQEFDHCGNPADRGTENHHARYYSQMELDGLPELVDFIFRTVMISLDRVEGITVETRRNVTASIPKGYGDPLELAKTFALWVAWKRGNEDPPAFAQPDFGLPDKEGVEPKKLSSKMLKQKQRQEAFEAYKMAPERQSARQKQQESVKAATAQVQLDVSPSGESKKSILGPRRVACDACRRRRIRCKHKDEVSAEMSILDPSTPSSAMRMPSKEVQVIINRPLAGLKGTPLKSSPAGPAYATPSTILSTPAGDTDPNSKRPRSKACPECRKSKRRCIHDEFGNVDPFKEQQSPIPRPTVSKKHKLSLGGESAPKRPKVEHDAVQVVLDAHRPGPVDSPIDPLLVQQDQVSFAQFAAQALECSLAAGVGDVSMAEAVGDETMVDDMMGDVENGVDDAKEASDEQDVQLEDEKVEAVDGGNDVVEEGEVAADEVPEADVDEQVEVALEENEESPEAVEGENEDGEGEEEDEATGNKPEETAAAAVVEVVAVVNEDDIVSDEQDLKLNLLDDRHDSASEVTKALSIEDEGESAEALLDDEDEQAAATSLPAATEDTADVADTESVVAAEELVDTKAETPSDNDPPSLSSASSPLSIAMSSPEPVEQLSLPPAAAPAPMRQSSRQAKPIARFSTSHFEGSLLTKPIDVKKVATPSMPAPASRKRKASSSTPGPVEMVSPSLKRVRAHTSRTPQPQPEETENERVAREIAGQSFGLRNRKSVNGI